MCKQNYVKLANQGRQFVVNKIMILQIKDRQFVVNKIMFKIANQRYTSCCKQKLLKPKSRKCVSLVTCKTIEVTDCKQSVKLV